ncbi:unnamed protein product [Hyaloperonospora brassicae]|uniref:mitogen-activated protein kinase kinase n=1 Tax=Hyaloperonospora brassicae TaxID=162125 RepID=A0AAV0U9R6_HYABA|nr:unnamed protein product [Hyaloperonospora brassicae]
MDDASFEELSPKTLMERSRKRERVESATYDQQAQSIHDSSDDKHGDRKLRLHSLFCANTVWDKTAPVGADRADRTLCSSAFVVQQKALRRPRSAPNLTEQADNQMIARIFPDICPRELRIAEVKLWKCPWMSKDCSISEKLETAREMSEQQQKQAMDTENETSTGVATQSSTHAESSVPDTVPTTSMADTCCCTDNDDTADHVDSTAKTLDNEVDAVASHLLLEEKEEIPPVIPEATDLLPSAGVRPPVPTTRSPAPLWKAVESARGNSHCGVTKRPQLRLKLEDMPTPQQAEERAQRAATRLIAKRDAIEAAAIAAEISSGSTDCASGPSAAQQAMMKLNLSSESESGLQSPDESGRHSAGSAYSPNHGMFTTRNVAVSEAGISSPDAACLHLQENLERVREVGRGASGVVYKAIHIPTLKVVAVKDVPVYGRGQRRQMVRELHALYSNLVPMADNDSPKPQRSSTGKSAGKAKAKPSPYIVSFYDAFVDRPKNSICMVMEYMSTGSLQDIVLRGGCRNEKVLARIAAGVLRGLSHIHKKRMVHRDIKPHNLLTNRQGEVKISDFGLARTLNDNSTSTKTFVGTLLYMAPERIGGGDYSYPADVWSFGLAMISVALGRYPLPTQDGFFGLVDFCVTFDPDERPSADTLLQHPFIHKYTAEETLAEWTLFIDQAHLCEERGSELESLSDAVYRHMYEHSVKFAHTPQSDYGVSFVSQATPMFLRRQVMLRPVQVSLQLGLANYLDVPVHLVYENFEEKRSYYSDKLLENYCYSPQSWTASPGISRRQQFGIGTDSPQCTPREKGSFWRKLQEGMSKLSHSKRKKERERRRSSAAS